jgi:hypothetical protein
MAKTIFYFILASIFAFACAKNDTVISDCGKLAVVDIQKYNDRSLQDSILNIIEDPIISNNCLALQIGYSGCNNKHVLDLVGDGSIAESLPVQTNFRIMDNNPQLCDAYFTDTYYFDLSPLKETFKSEKSVKLNFPDQKKSIVWQIE